MYRVCSLCLIPIDLSVCPTYELLQVLHFSLYIPLEFISFLVILSLSFFVYGVCDTKGYVYVGMFEYVSYFVYKWTAISECDPFLCVCMINVCCVLVISLFLRLWIICSGNPLFLAIVSMLFSSRCLACSVIGSVITLFI